MPARSISLYFSVMQIVDSAFRSFICTFSVLVTECYVFWIAHSPLGPSVMWHFLIVLWWLYHASDAAVRPQINCREYTRSVPKMYLKHHGVLSTNQIIHCSDLKYKLIKKRAQFISPFHNAGSSLSTSTCCYKSCLQRPLHSQLSKCRLKMKEQAIVSSRYLVLLVTSCLWHKWSHRLLFWKLWRCLLGVNF